MIKKTFSYMAIAFFLSCGQQKREQVALTEENQTSESPAPEEKSPLKGESWLNPAYLSADFNGDGYVDTAFAVILNNKKGIKIKHGNTNTEIVIGAGNDFGNGGDDFDWIENWNLVKDKKTYEVTFTEDDDIDGSREVALEHTAFYIGTEEAGGATIAWKEGKYIWIHQAD